MSDSNPKSKAGRPKGTPNKRTEEQRKKAQELGIDPFEVLLLFAKGDWAALGYSEERYICGSNDHGTFFKYTIDPSVRAKCASEACSFLFPKLKAIEHSGSVETIPASQLSDEELDELIKVKEAALKDDE